MKKLYRAAAFVLAGLISITGVKAESGGSGTASDLFKLFDKSAENEYMEVEKEYLKAKDEYNREYESILDAESFNKMYESAEAYQKMKLKELDSAVSSLMSDNNNIAGTISSNLHGDITELLKLDAAYKTNVDEVNTLLAEKNKYSLTSKKQIDYGRLDELEVEVGSLKKEYDKAVEGKSLGDIKKVKYPLNAETITTSPFGDRIDPVTEKSVKFHAGIDLQAEMNTEVLSLFNGVVAGTGYGPSGGYFVRVTHDNGVTTYYCHLSQIKCTVGQKVKQYDVIALSGNSGSKITQSHLHLGLYLDGIAVDPAVLFDEGE